VVSPETFGLVSKYPRLENLLSELWQKIKSNNYLEEIIKRNLR
jgi:hypothetical protein